ncbi:iron-containing alcohol dehydrogenase [Bordetella petrii]|nr:iron-containing alcohol dehydrogenase [Bordetella petrii]
MTLPDIATFFCPTRLYLGAGAAQARIPELLRRHDCQRVFVAIDAAVRESDFYNRIRTALCEAGIAIAEYSDIEPDPSAHTVARAFDTCKAHGATVQIAIGGGSTIDVAKAVGILATNGGRIHDYEGIEKFDTPGLPLIAVPTTAGTGSEVSGSCVITDTEQNRKMSIRHAALNPAAYAVLDPLALRTMPAHVAAHSGMDAFVHAFESYLSRQANLVTDAINLQAVELIAANLRPFVANRENLQAGLNMLVGSALAGITFGQTGLGNVHCMARFVGAVCHVSHGLSNAVCLPAVARFNLLANPAKYARIAAAMGCAVQGLPELDAARAAVDAIEALCRDLDIPARLRDIGAAADSLPQMAQWCSEAGYNRWNPRHTTRADFEALFQAAY